MKCKICGSESGNIHGGPADGQNREKAGEIIKMRQMRSWHYAGSPCHCKKASGIPDLL